VIVYQPALLYQQKRKLMQDGLHFWLNSLNSSKKLPIKKRVVYHQPEGGFEPRRHYKQSQLLNIQQELDKDSMSILCRDQWRITVLVSILMLSFLEATPTPATTLQLQSTISQATYGPANESCATDGVILTPQDNWKTRLEGADPGETLLLRAGTYRTDSLRAPAGTSTRRITVKPYNCESVSLDTVIRPNSFITFAGLTLGGSVPAVISVESTSLVEGLTIRNNTLISRGSGKDPVRLWGSGGLKDLLIEGNSIINGNVKASNASTFDIQTQGTNIVIRNNHITTPSGNGFGDDTFEWSDWGGTWTIENNWFSGAMDENLFDVKHARSSTGNVITLRHNYFDGSNAQDACTLFHGKTNDGTWPFFYTIHIEGNYFFNCKEGGIHWRSVGPDGPSGNPSDGALNIGELVIRENIFDMPNTTTWSIRVARSNIAIINNTMYLGKLTIDSGYNLPDPKNVVVKNNIFYKTNMTGSQRIDTCRNNDFFQMSGAPGNCPGSIIADPQFVDPTNGNYALKSTSPTIGVGEDGGDMGALPSGEKRPLPPSNLRVSVSP
jgi:hypothetical protein